MRKQVRARVVPELVASRVVEPPVVPDGERESEDRDPLHGEQPAEDVQGAYCGDERARAS